MKNPILAALAAKGDPAARTKLIAQAARASAAVQKRSAPTPSALRAMQWGQPSHRLVASALVLRIVHQHCTCGATHTYINPDLLVRFSNSDGSTIREIPHSPALANPALPRLIEEAHELLPACPACFSTVPAGQLALPLPTPPLTLCHPGELEREEFRALRDDDVPSSLSAHTDPTRFTRTLRS